MKAFQAIKIVLLCSFILASMPLAAQSAAQKKLEAQRATLQKEIQEINRLLLSKNKEESNVLDAIEDLNTSIRASENLIRLTNRQANLLQREIAQSSDSIAQLRKELKLLKDDYAQMIRKSYVNKSQQNRLLFLLSSQNFYQAYKRLQYMKQYTQYRKKQGEAIVVKTELLSKKVSDLEVQKKLKVALVAQNKTQKEALEKKKGTQSSTLASIRKNKRKYTSQINDKKKQTKALDDRIERMIKEAIAAANKKATNTSKKETNSFVLTPEAKRIASNFTANKGRLVWPVSKGIVKRGFGIYSDPVYPEIKHQNNGVIIATDKNTEARSIFDGEVVAILRVPGGNLGVQIRHGNYISTYYNLNKLYVKQGDQVKEKEAIGVISTSGTSGQTQLKFYLYQNTQKLNPQEWIYRM